ncbi:THO complex subunit 4 isoform X2 [Drosophila mauritiana]|uniref:THO complex subunit 4 isoform X2 n=1 Tax=Drosophila mauritiana TaxID=7226 RepID=A0A6P8KES1_DROMA|nr:THO complex subunit 4 isoform X2 [Drosophila mauritiana]
MTSHLIATFLLLVLGLNMSLAAIHKRSGANSLGVDPEAKPAANPAVSVENTDLLDKLSWKCANNASCLYGVANGLMASYRRGETLKLGLFDLVKLPELDASRKHKWGTGRGLSSFMDFVTGNAIRVPVGPMVFSVQRAEDDSDYIEVALLKKASSSTGRLQGNGGGLLGGGGGLGGNGGGGGGLLGGGGGDNGGGGGLLGGRRRHQHQDKKQFQMFIPMYLAATTFGWTMVAAKAVGLLTLKALILSKIAFVVAAIVLIKKLMDNASEKMMYQFPEQTPYMMPYGMDYPLHGAEISPEMYPSSLHHLAMAGGGQLPGHPGHPGLESLSAESHLHSAQVSSDGSNNTQVLAALGGLGGLGHKIKREDSWMAKTTPARRPLIYNYVQPHMPYYRS